MSSPTYRLLAPLCLLALTLACASSASADEPTASLYERRLGIIKGTAKGVVLSGPSSSAQAAPPAQAAASAPSGAIVPTGNSEKPAAAPSPVPAKSEFLNGLPRPSGRPLNTARRMGAVDGGITLSTGRTATQPPAEPAEKR